MGSFHTIPVILRTGFILLGFIGNAAILALHHISYVNFIGQHIGNGKILPKCAVPALWLLVPQAVLPFIFCGIRYAALIKHPGNGGLSVPLRKEGENLPHNCGCLFIYDEVSLLLRIFLVAVERKSADMKAVFAAIGENGTDIFRHVLQIPFIDQTIDLTGFLVALVRRISVVNQTDKADAPNGEKPIDILFYQFQFAGKTGLALAKNDVKLMCFGIVQQTLEFRPIPVRTGVIIIAVNVIYFPALLNGIFQQHGLLILDAVAVIRFLFLVAVFFRQSAINRNLFHLLCLRSI